MNAHTKIIPGAVHPLACKMQGSHVQNGCTIGARTRVWQFASVIRRAEIGEDCSIAANAIVDGAIVGHRCIIGHGASIHPGALIADDVFIGPCATLCNDAWPRAHKDGFDIEGLLDGDIVSIKIEQGASIGSHATILPGVIVGANAMVAAGAVVYVNIPDDHIFHRDGRLEKIDPKRPAHRMRHATA